MYDVETGLYYLRSRYYDPVWGRFLNADSLIKGNLFTYCENMVSTRVDTDGKKSFSSLTQREKDYILDICFWSSIYLRIKGYDISESLFKHFIWGEGKPIDVSLSKIIGDRVKNSSEFKKTLNSIHENEKNVIWRRKDVIEFSGDLFYSLQHISLYTIGFRIDDKTYGFSFFTDYYDFKYRTNEDEGRFFQREVNNLGYSLQEAGYGTNFWVYSWFTFEY